MIGKPVDHKTAYYGIFVHEEDRGGPIEYWITDDHGGDRYIGTTHPTKKQIAAYADAFVNKGVGMSIPACIRAFAMSEFNMPYADANCLAVDVEDHLRGAHWLELSDGTTFDRSWLVAKRGD